MSVLLAPDPQAQRAIVENEIALWCNTRYQMQLRYRVRKAIGETPEQLQEIETELIKCEAALDELQKVLNEIAGNRG